MLNLDDTIVAPVTPLQASGVAIIRVSGEIALRIGASMIARFVPVPNLMQFGRLQINGEPVDEGYVCYFEPEHSFTGEPTIEIFPHGSPHLVSKLIHECIRLGCRAAEPGEFTKRAFMNGRIDLTEAEAVRETVEASTEMQLRRAASLRAGLLSEKVCEISEQVGQQLAVAEATIDFSEEIGDLDRPAAIVQINHVLANIDSLLKNYLASRIVREGLRVALVGRPNVGKSSLLNALIGANRAIVTDTPGTTRDTIEEAININGYAVVITDTAGIRDTDHEVEKIGVERSREAVNKADEVWLIYEAHQGWTDADELLLNSLPSRIDLFIANKSDLGHGKLMDNSLLISAQQGSNMTAIADYVRDKLSRFAAIDTGFINERHKEHLESTREMLLEAVETLGNQAPTDLACVSLRSALFTLGNITGETAPEEVIERIFRDFCIGK